RPKAWVRPRKEFRVKTAVDGFRWPNALRGMSINGNLDQTVERRRADWYTEPAESVASGQHCAKNRYDKASQLMPQSLVRDHWEGRYDDLCSAAMNAPRSPRHLSSSSHLDGW